MLALIILFPAMVMIIWHHRLNGKSIDRESVLVEYLVSVLLINCILLLASYVIGGNTNSIANTVNSYSYLFLSLMMAILIPYICNEICKHCVLDTPLILKSEKRELYIIYSKNVNSFITLIHNQFKGNGCFHSFIIFLTAIVCFLCALFFSGSTEINNTGIIIVWICILTIYIIYLRYARIKLSTTDIIVLLFITGFLLRLNYVLYTTVDVTTSVRQHDVGIFFKDNWGHAAYIDWFFNKWFALPENPNLGQFYHPPLHHFLTAVWMHIFTHFFSFSVERAVTSIQYLTLFYSSCCMIVTERILSALNIRRTGKVVTFSLVAFHPTFIILAGSINNDILSTLLTLLAIYTTIKWYQSPSLKNIILISLSVGLGMMTKLTVAVIAPSIAAVFLIKIIQAWKQKQSLSYFKQYCAFGCICIPLGMSYPLWKFVNYNVPLNYVQPLPLDSGQYVGFHSIYERLLDFSYYPFQSPYEAWGAASEYNPLVAVAKTSVFGEYANWGVNGTLLFSSRLLLYINILLIILSIAAMIFVMVKKNRAIDRTLKLFLITYQIILFMSYIVFCFQHQHTCSMDYRYIVPTCILGSIYIGFMYDWISEIKGRWSNAAKIIRCCIMCGAVLFCLLVSTVYVIYGIS